MSDSVFPPSAEVPADASFEGAIEGVMREGCIAGWARRLDGRGPVTVRLLLHGVDDSTEIIGEAAAIHYRRHLLVACKSLGHCAFFARPRRPLPPGIHEISLRALPEGREIVTRVPLLWPENPTEDPTLPSRRDEPAAWTDEDVLAHLDQFDLDRHYQALGAERFVDRAYAFILNRWMDDAGRETYPPALREGRMTPRQLFDIMIRSEERQNNINTPLPSPYHYRFPFPLG